MIARHGYITINQHGCIILDESRCETDEGIICQISNGKIDIARGTDRPMPVMINHQDANVTLDNYSLGYVLRRAICIFATNLYIMTTKFINRLSLEVIYVDIFDPNNKLSYTNYIAITSQGIFMFTGDTFGRTDRFISMDDPIKGYKITNSTSSWDLYKALIHDVPFDDIFDDRVPFVRRVCTLSDVIIHTTD